MGEKLRKKIAGPNLGKLAEEKRKLKDVEFNLNAAQKIAHVGSWSLDIEKNILEWSDECYRIFGLKKGTPLSYEKFLKKVYPEDRGIVGEAWKAALKGKRYDIEHRINTKPIKLVRERAKLTFNKKGEPIRGIGTVQDITGGKAAEELTERYKFVIEQSAHQIAFADFNGKIIYVNNSWAVGHGYKKEELIGKPISIFHPKEELKKVKNFNKTLIKTGSCSGEIIHKRKNGTTYPSLMNNFVLKVRGKPAYMIGIAIDITEKKKDEERLANEKNLLDSSMESLPGIFYMFDDKGKFFKWNKNWEKASEYSSKEMGKAHPLDFFRGEDKTHIASRIKEVFVKGESNAEAEFVSKSGKRRNYYFTGKLMKLNNKTYLVGMGIDITEKKKAESEIKRLNDELKKDAEVSEAKYKDIYESSADAIMVLEPPTWKFTSGNPSAIKMFGAKDEKEFTSNPPWKYSPKFQPDEKTSEEKAKEMIMVAMKDGKNFFEWTHKRLHDGDFSATVLLTRMRIEGKDVLQATVRDITKKKRG